MPERSGGQAPAAAGDRAVVCVGGDPLYLQPLDIRFNSPDIDGNLVVDLSDTVLYSGDILSGGYAYRSDFYFDQRLNLSDTVIYAGAVGKTCP